MTEGSARDARIHSLDWIRGMASLAVCWHHLTTYQFGRALESDLLSVIRSSGKYGWLGVPAFFVISGFVIPCSLHQHRFKLRHYKTFILKRVIRLDPPYLCSVLLGVGVGIAYSFWKGESYHADTIGILFHLGYLNAIVGREWINPVYWTLGIEIQYYLSVALFFPIVFTGNQWLRRSFILIGAVICLALPAHCLLMQRYRFIFPSIPLFLMGIIACQYYFRAVELTEMIALLIPVVICSLLKLDGLSTLVGVITCFLVLTPLRPTRISRFLGNISYSLYLIHYPLCTLSLSLLGITVLGSLVLGKVLAIFYALGVALISGWTLYRLVERPSQKLSSSFRYSQ